MLPSSDLLFSFFNRVIKSLLLGFKSNDENDKKQIAKDGRSIASQENRESSVGVVVSEMLREHYCHMSDCTSVLDRSLCGLREELARPVLPCAAQRRALQLCYTTHTLEPLNCQHLVTQLKECARKYALQEHQ